MFRVLVENLQDLKGHIFLPFFIWMKTEKGFTSVTGPCGDLIKMGRNSAFHGQIFIRKLQQMHSAKEMKSHKNLYLQRILLTVSPTGKEFMHDKKKLMP